MPIATKSQILDPTGTRAESSRHWRAPSDKSEYFGWMGADGFSTIHVKSVRLAGPHMVQEYQHRPPVASGNYYIVLDGGVQVIINAEDAMRLLRRLGWYDPDARQ